VQPPGVMPSATFRGGTSRTLARRSSAVACMGHRPAACQNWRRHRWLTGVGRRREQNEGEERSRHMAPDYGTLRVA
jgi:hypothetical protein